MPLPYCLVLFFASLACFAGSSSSQTPDNLQTDLSSGNTELIRNALFTIKTLHTESASRLALPALSDKNVIVRATAASAVIFIPKTEAVQVLLPLLSDKSELVRNEAVLALGEIRDPSATTPLLRTLEKDNRIVKAAAAIALGKIGDRTAIGPLTKILSGPPNEDTEFLRRSSARSIGLIAESLLQQAHIPRKTPSDNSPNGYLVDVQLDRVTLSEMPEFRSATAVLSRVLGNKKETDDTRREAAFALGSIGGPSSVPLLRANLHSSDNYLAEICKEAILKIQAK